MTMTHPYFWRRRNWLLLCFSTFGAYAINPSISQSGSNTHITNHRLMTPLAPSPPPQKHTARGGNGCTHAPPRLQRQSRGRTAPRLPPSPPLLIPHRRPLSPWRREARRAFSPSPPGYAPTHPSPAADSAPAPASPSNGTRTTGSTRGETEKQAKTSQKGGADTQTRTHIRTRRTHARRHIHTRTQHASTHENMFTHTHLQTHAYTHVSLLLLFSIGACRCPPLLSLFFASGAHKKK